MTMLTQAHTPSPPCYFLFQVLVALLGCIPVMVGDFIMQVSVDRVLRVWTESSKLLDESWPLTMAKEERGKC